KRPHGVGGREVRGGVAEGRDGQAAGPGVAAVLHGAERDLGAAAALEIRAAAGVAVHEGRRRHVGAAVAHAPAGEVVGDGDEALRRAAGVGHERVGGAVEVDDRHRARGRAGRHAVDAGDGRDGGDAIGELAADAVRHEAAVGHAGDEDAVRVDAQAIGGGVEEVLDEADVVDVVGGGLAAAGAGVPGRV